MGCACAVQARATSVLPVTEDAVSVQDYDLNWSLKWRRVGCCAPTTWSMIFPGLPLVAGGMKGSLTGLTREGHLFGTLTDEAHDDWFAFPPVGAETACLPFVDASLDAATGVVVAVGSNGVAYLGRSA